MQHYTGRKPSPKMTAQMWIDNLYLNVTDLLDFQLDAMGQTVEKAVKTVESVTCAGRAVWAKIYKQYL